MADKVVPAPRRPSPSPPRGGKRARPVRGACLRLWYPQVVYTLSIASATLHAKGRMEAITLQREFAWCSPVQGSAILTAGRLC